MRSPARPCAPPISTSEFGSWFCQRGNQALSGIGIWNQPSVGIYDTIGGITRNLANPQFHFLL